MKVIANTSQSIDKLSLLKNVKAASCPVFGEIFAEFTKSFKMRSQHENVEENKQKPDAALLEIAGAVLVQPQMQNGQTEQIKNQIQPEMPNINDVRQAPMAQQIGFNQKTELNKQIDQTPAEDINQIQQQNSTANQPVLASQPDAAESRIGINAAEPMQTEVINSVQSLKPLSTIQHIIGENNAYHKPIESIIQNKSPAAENSAIEEKESWSDTSDAIKKMIVKTSEKTFANNKEFHVLPDKMQSIANDDKKTEAVKPKSDITVKAENISAAMNLAKSPADSAKVNTDSKAPDIVPPLHEQVYNGISEGIRRGNKEFTVTLKPEGLGELKVKLSSENGRMNFDIVSANEQTASLISEHLTELKSAIQTHRIEISSINVSVESIQAKSDISRSGGQQDLLFDFKDGGFTHEGNQQDYTPRRFDPHETQQEKADSQIFWGSGLIDYTI